MTDVSARVTVLVKEELELAKAEVQQKIKSLSKGLIAGAVGAVFALLFIPFALATLAWGLNSAFTSIWLGFLIVTALLLALMGGAFLFAWRKLKVGAPVPVALAPVAVAPAPVAVAPAPEPATTEEPTVVAPVAPAAAAAAEPADAETADEPAPVHTTEVDAV